MAAIGLWIGFGQMLPFLLYAAIFGGVFALFLILFRKLPLPMALASRPWLLRLHGHEEGIPYGVALAGAALVVLPQTAIAGLAV
jgi:prepilin peptidase CpaA